MRKTILVFSGVAFFLVMGIGFFVPTEGQCQAIAKKPLPKEQLEIIKQKIKTGEDAIRLDPDNKGSFSWWGYLEEPGDWDFYSLVCGDGNLEIHLTSIPEGSDYDLYLFDCNDDVIAISDNGGNTDEEIIEWVSTDTYQIGIYCWSGGDSSDSYHLYGTYVTPPPLPDLIVQSLTASDYTPAIGDEITITLTVKNIGNATSSGFWTDLFEDEMFPPGVPSTGDYYWWTSWLDPGETAQFTQVVTNDEVETWHMYGLTDSEGYITEKNECNNVKGPVDVNWYGLPDLVVEQVMVSDSQPFIDEYIDVTVTIKNQGGTTQGTFWTDLYYNLSDPPAPQTPGDRSFSKNGLGAGESYSHTFYSVSYQSPYLWKMWVYVDSWLNIQEDNEDNNIDSVSIFWREHPISDNYGWPIHPSNQQHALSSTFMEWRSGSAGGDYNQHFHDGIDIPYPENTPVYSVSAGFAWFTEDMKGIYVNEFLYYHVKNFTISRESTWVNSDSLIAKIAHWDYGDHLHFNDGQNQQEVNPLREYGITPFTDSINPIFYSNPITLREDDPNVGGWDGGADGAIIDKDSVYGNVDVIVHAKDEIDAGRRVGLYAISYQICDQNCWPLTGEILNFTFDNWYGNYYVNFIYADTFKYIITNQITSNGYWNTAGWSDGTYCLCINAYDIVSFYKKFVLKDTTKLNVTPYFLEDVEVKNGGNHNPEIEGHLHCKYPYDECNECIKYGQEFTLEITATDEDGDSMYYEWVSYNWGWFIVNGTPTYICTTYENFVTYQAPGFPHTYDQLQVTVYDDRGGWASIQGWLGVYDPATSCLCGDANGDDYINSADIVFINNYLFFPGAPDPDPMETADVNNDCVVNSADVTYLINYLFVPGAPRPECCWILPFSEFTPSF